MKKLKVAVVGAGYVGLSLALLLVKQLDVTLIDIDQERLKKIANGISPLRDDDIEKALADPTQRPHVEFDPLLVYPTVDYVVIATPTNYDPELNAFDTTSVEQVISDVLSCTDEACIVIKSTVPIGFTARMRSKSKSENIVFSPEFLREGRALYDNLHPSRIVVGDRSKAAARFAELLRACSENADVPILLTESTEAEAIKLFANSYLALRIAYFNELDSFALVRGLDTKAIVDGVCLDPRIGNHYNNPSFGYGGYCLPKDTKQLLASYSDVPQILIAALVSSNTTRKELMADRILSRNPKVVGIYRLIMKAGSDNFRFSAIQDIIQSLQKSGVTLVIYEPSFAGATFMDIPVSHDFANFKKTSDVIMANRMHQDLGDVIEKVFTRDLFNRD
jgi:UDPglucose 6-dehydrogenase